MDHVLQEFLAESWKNLMGLDAEFVGLEDQLDNSSRIADIFRRLHTIKGNCGFIGLSQLGSVAHAAEGVLGQMRSGRLPASKQCISLVIEAVDEIKRLLRNIEIGDHEPPGANRELMARLDELAATANVRTGRDDRELGSRRTVPLGPSPVRTRPTDLSPPKMALAKTDPPTKLAQLSEPNAADEHGDSVTDRSIRVNADVLDGLVKLVGELVSTRNELLPLLRKSEDCRYASAIGQLNRVTTGLQECVLKVQTDVALGSPENEARTRSTERTSLLVFDAGASHRMAIPLSLVARLEKIPRHGIERTEAGLVVQYRGSLLPLLPVDAVESARLCDPQQAIVISDGSRSIGLLVERVEDIVDEHLVIRIRSWRPGILGTAIVNGRATDIIDARHYLTGQNVDPIDINVEASACVGH